MAKWNTSDEENVAIIDQRKKQIQFEMFENDKQTKKIPIAIHNNFSLISQQYREKKYREKLKLV